MKKILSILTIVLLAAVSAIAQSPSPGIFNYQGVARNSVGNVLINKTITLRLTIHDGAAAGPTVYQESRSTVTNPFGLFNVQVGSPGATNVTGTIAGVNWGVNTKFIQVEIDPNGGTSFINIGTAQLASVPYSLYSSLSNDLVLPFNKTQSNSGSLFNITNSGSGSAIVGNGTSGAGIVGTSSTGNSGRFENTNASNTADVIYASTNSTSINPASVHGVNGSSGITISAKKGVWGESDNGVGVYGTSRTGNGIFGTTSTGPTGIYGFSFGTGLGVSGSSLGGTAAEFTLAAGNSSRVLNVRTAGTGVVGNFENTNAANTAATVSVASNATTGRGIFSSMSGTGQVSAVTGFISTTAVGSAGINGADFSTGGVSPIEGSTYGVLGQTGMTGIAVGGYAAGGGTALRGSGGGVLGFALSTTGNVRHTGIGEANNFILRSDAAGNATWVDPAIISPGAFLWTRVGTNMWNTNLGDKVGIGTTTPAANLHLVGTMQIDKNPVTVLPAATHVDEDFRINSVDAQLALYSLQNLSNSGAISFKEVDLAGNLINHWAIQRKTSGAFEIGYGIGADPGSTTPLMRILPNGNVGIGNSAPSYKLDILHSGSTGILNKSSAGFSVFDIDAFSGDAAIRFANNGVNQWNLRNQPGTDNLQIFELGGGGERLSIQNTTGNIAIGGSPGNYQLDILHPGSTGILNKSSGGFSVVDIDAFSGDAALRFANNGVNQWNIRNQPGTDNLQIFELGGGGERMRIDNTTGQVVISGDFTVLGTKAFTMDHPLDPANKLLRHAAAESNEVINFYSGNITTDAGGKATVKLPDYYEALNKDSRYQLTVIGSFAQAIISKKVSNNQFEIATSQPNVEVSWEVKGVRNDARMKQQPFVAVEEKSAAQKGKYLDPQSHNQPLSKGVSYDANTESSLNYAPKTVTSKVVPATTGGSLDPMPVVKSSNNKTVVKGESTEDVPAAKTPVKTQDNSGSVAPQTIPEKKVPATKVPESTKTD